MGSPTAIQRVRPNIPRCWNPQRAYLRDELGRGSVGRQAPRGDADVRGRADHHRSREKDRRGARGAGADTASGSGSCGVAAARKHGESSLRFTVKGVAQRRL